MELLILFVLILLNGLFAMSEMAVVSSRKVRLQQWADEGRAGAKAALAVANDPSNFLSTIQVGITVIGVTSGAFGEASFATALNQLARAVAGAGPLRRVSCAGRRGDGHHRCLDHCGGIGTQATGPP